MSTEFRVTWSGVTSMICQHHFQLPSMFSFMLLHLNSHLATPVWMCMVSGRLSNKTIIIHVFVCLLSQQAMFWIALSCSFIFSSKYAVANFKHQVWYSWGASLWIFLFWSSACGCKCIYSFHFFYDNWILALIWICLISCVCVQKLWRVRKVRCAFTICETQGKNKISSFIHLIVN